MTASTTLPARTATSPVALHRLLTGALVGAAGLIGFGLILFIAANWDDIGRFGRFGLVASVILAGGLGALARPALHTPALLLAFAATGGMLALIGQTYQTGADTWQLFALWAALTLPWALAARSDAVWMPWVVVAMTAIALGQHTYATFTSMMPTGSAAGAFSWPVVLAWCASLGLAWLMSPLGLSQAWAGTRRWAFRMALALALVLVASETVGAVLGWPRARIEIFLIGLACLAGIALALVRLLALDFLLLAATALAIDAALISAIVRLVVPKNGSTASFILIGLVAALIVATSVVLIMRVAGSGLPRLRALPSAALPAADASRPWPVILLSGIGAILAAVPFIVALAIMLGRTLEKGPAAYIIAAIVLPVAVLALRNARGLFAEQLATVGLACGTMLLVFGLFRDLPMGAAGLLSGLLALGMAVWLDRAWLGALLGAASTAGFALAMTSAISSLPLPHGSTRYALVWSVVALGWIAAVYGLREHRPWLQPLGGKDTLDATAAGWGAAALAGLAVGSGSTFLLGATLGLGGMGHQIGSFSPALLILVRGVSIALGLAACGLALRERPELRTPLGIAVLSCAVVLAAVMPGLGAVLLMLAVAVAMGQRTIAIAAVAAVLWVIGAFYYNLSMTLMQKAAILAGAGAALGGVALAAGARWGFGNLTTPASLPQLTPALTRGLAAFGLLAVAGVSAEAIRAKEALIRDGRPVFVELVPVDPRSLMQGDYMALRFALPDAALRHHPVDGSRPRAIGRIDDKGVVRLTRIGDARSPVAADEIRIELTPKNGRSIVVTDAWFFKEGNAKPWEAARFGELRVLPDGRALLVGLADKDRKAIR